MREPSIWAALILLTGSGVLACSRTHLLGSAGDARDAAGGDVQWGPRSGDATA